MRSEATVALVRPGFLTPARIGVVLTLTLLAGVATATTSGPLMTSDVATLQTEALAAAPLDASSAATRAVPVAAPAAGPDRAPAAPVAPPVPGSPPSSGPAVAPLTELRSPDLLITLPASLPADQAAALSALRDVLAVSVVDAGTVKVGGQDARMLGVDPSSFRPFTPQETAQSDLLWQSVARGEVAPSYGLAKDRQLVLGGPIALGGAAPAGPEIAGRIGALAGFGLPGVDLVTDRTRARALGVVPESGVLVSAPARSIRTLRTAVQEILGKDAIVDVLRPEVPAARKGKPRNYRELYIDSARYCKGMSWTVLAAIGQVESGHGRNLGPSSAGALGPMQFLPSTWDAYGLDGDKDGTADIMNPFDAVPSAAAYLCRFGANRGPDGLYNAVFAYNHADWYVQKVLGLAAQYK